jgi:HSP20 family molecular chaperone IbpA
MFKKKKSLLSRITGRLRMDDDSYDDEIENDDIDTVINEDRPIRISPTDGGNNETPAWMIPDAEEDAELSVDLFDNGKEIIVQTMVAGVRPEDLSIDIRRDSIVIQGNRKETHTIKEDNYVVRELYWGSFSRTLNLPEEVDPDLSEATEKHGLLVIRLPKIDKGKQKKVKVKSI